MTEEAANRCKKFCHPELDSGSLSIQPLSFVLKDCESSPQRQKRVLIAAKTPVILNLIQDLSAFNRYCFCVKIAGLARNDRRGC
jgi:hypothetical protein